MSTNDSRYDLDSLDTDIDFSTPLRRVSFQAGMLLGVEATQSEQDYHRRRLVRHNYWFHGYGTLLGMAVTLDGNKSKNEGHDGSLTINVSPGIGIDGLGREIIIVEPYCINLSDWLASQQESDLAAGIDRDSDDDLRLVITVRYQDCASGLQPTMASRLNDSTDPVSPSRISDSLLLEIEASRRALDERPWPAHDFTIDDSQNSKFSDLEKAALTPLSTDEKAQRTRQAQLIYALTKDAEAQKQPDLSASEAPETSAHILLAELRIKQVLLLTEAAQQLNLKNTDVNNLIRPFVYSHAQIAKRILL